MKFAIFVVLVSSVVSAQTFQGVVRGRVLDPSGGAATVATITLTDEGTLVSRRTITNDQGEYTFAAVTPSIYTVTVESAGFKRIEQKGVNIGTQEAVTDDGGHHVLGPIKLTGWAWSSTPGKSTGEAWSLDFGDGGRASVVTGDSGLNRALCVRRAQ